MSKKHNVLEVSAKSTKEQILAAYNEVLTKLTEKQLSTPQEQKKQEEEQNIIKKTDSHSPDNILTDLSNLKSKTIKQIDGLSEQLLSEFEKLANLHQAITIEQNTWKSYIKSMRLQILYQHYYKLNLNKNNSLN